MGIEFDFKWNKKNIYIYIYIERERERERERMKWQNLVSTQCNFRDVQFPHIFN